jgi:hypothetical protein
LGDDRLELGRARARVRGRDQFRDPLLARRRQRGEVVVEHRPQGLLRLPLGVRGRQRLDAVQGKGELGVHWVLDPQRAIVVERGNALDGGHEVERARRRHLVHKGSEVAPV